MNHITNNHEDDDFLDIDQYIKNTSDDWAVSGSLKLKYDIQATYDDRKNLHGKLLYVNSSKINIYECDYVHGVKHGKEIFRFKKGGIKETCIYKNKVLRGKREYFDWSGSLIKEEHYLNGLYTASLKFLNTVS